MYRVLAPSHTRSLLLKPQQMLPNRYAKKQLQTACMCSTDITLGVQLCSMHLKDRCFKGGPPALMLLSKEGEVALPYTLQSYGTGGLPAQSGQQRSVYLTALYSVFLQYTIMFFAMHVVNCMQINVSQT